MTTGNTSLQTKSGLEPSTSITQPSPSAGVPADAPSCRPCEAKDSGAWSRFLATQPAANLGHDLAWKGVVEQAYSKPAYFLAAFDGGDIEGVLPLVHMRGALGGNRLVSLPFLDQSGLLASTPAAAASLWSAATELARKLGVRGIDLRALGDADRREADRATLVLPLECSGEALWKSFSPKVRNQIRKSEKEGLSTASAAPDELNEFFPVFARNMRDLGSPTHSRAFLAAVLGAFGPAATLYLTRDAQKRAVGGAIALRSGDTITVPWASSLREVFSSCPNHSLYWRILADAAEGGVKRFDFGRSHVSSGTYKFKTQWGAEPRPLLWTSFDAAGQPQQSSILKPSEHQKLTWVWSRLPVALATWLGPMVRKKLSN